MNLVYPCDNLAQQKTELNATSIISHLCYAQD